MCYILRKAPAVHADWELYLATGSSSLLLLTVPLPPSPSPLSETLQCRSV